MMLGQMPQMILAQGVDVTGPQSSLGNIIVKADQNRLFSWRKKISLIDARTRRRLRMRKDGRMAEGWTGRPREQSAAVILQLTGTLAFPADGQIHTPANSRVQRVNF